MVTYKLNGSSSLSNREREQLLQAEMLPVVYDEDSPELTAEMEHAFIAARRAKPYCPPQKAITRDKANP